VIVGARAALRAEWTKARTAPGTTWLLLAAVALTVTVSVAAAASVRCPAGGCSGDPAKVSLTGIYLGQAVVAILAVSAISGEYGTGMIRLTLAAMPGRTTVLAAKAVIVTGLVLAAGAVAVLVSLLAGRLILAGHGYAPGHPLLAFGDGAVVRAAVGSVLYLALIAVFGLGIGAAARDAGVAIGLVLGLLYLFPIAATAIGDQAVARRLDQIGPMSAGLDSQTTIDLHGLPLAPWAGLGVVALWAAGVIAAGGVLLWLRDA
jgi:ABC-2 type transport system permease protein